MNELTKPEYFKALFSNPVFRIALISFLASQFVKGVIVLIKENHKFKAFTAFAWNTGGIPSSHSALVSSIAGATAIYEGFNSTLFVITLFYAFITLRDALGVRRSAGLQAKSLNELWRKFAEKEGIELKSVKEIEGHNPFEVLCGIVLGVFVAFFYYYLTN